MTNNKDKDLFTKKLMFSAKFVVISLIMVIVPLFGTSKLTPADKASVVYQQFGANGLKYGLLIIALGLFLYGVISFVRNARALRRIKRED